MSGTVKTEKRQDRTGEGKGQDNKKVGTRKGHVSRIKPGQRENRKMNSDKYWDNEKNKGRKRNDELEQGHENDRE